MLEADKNKIAKIALTKAQLVKKLKELAKSVEGWEWDKEWESPETAHVKADLALLAFIGDEEVTKAFHSIHKWYA